MTHGMEVVRWIVPKPDHVWLNQVRKLYFEKARYFETDVSTQLDIELEDDNWFGVGGYLEYNENSF